MNQPDRPIYVEPVCFFPAYGNSGNHVLYKEALGLVPVREKEASDGSFKLVYLGDGKTDFTLELTWLRDRTEAYNLGECEFHLAFHVDDFDDIHKHHEEMGCICYENPGMGIYFITDPDGYWLEIVPARG